MNIRKNGRFELTTYAADSQQWVVRIWSKPSCSMTAMQAKRRALSWQLTDCSIAAWWKRSASAKMRRKQRWSTRQNNRTKSTTCGTWHRRRRRCSSRARRKRRRRSMRPTTHAATFVSNHAPSGGRAHAKQRFIRCAWWKLRTTRSARSAVPSMAWRTCKIREKT